MADRLSWWVIPGALIVLARVVTLGNDAPVDPPAVPATAIADPVVLQDASGRRSDVRSWSELTATALVLDLPEAHVGQDGAVILWRRDGARRDAVAAFDAKCRVDDTGAVRIAGLPAGTYDAQVTFGTGTAAVTLRATVEAPGHATLAAAASPGR